MTTIRSMTATFGKLEGAKLTLGPGLNLVHAPNESGKSTWAAFYKAMLFGIDTRDRDKKGYLAAKNRFLPWSGAPMAGEIILDWKGREIAIRRSQRGAAPFGNFSAVYTDTGEKVPGMTGETCGQLITGVSREVFERSAFIGGDSLALTAAPDLERRITALLTAGEEDVSYSQTQAALKGWLNRRRVNRTVGQIPRLEGELAQVRESLTHVEDCQRRVKELEHQCTGLKTKKQGLTDEGDIHRRLARQELNARYARAEEDYAAALSQLDKLEGELARFGTIPPRDEVKKAQFELQYLKVLEEEIRAAETDLAAAEEAYIQAQRAAQDDRFPGMTAQQARSRVEELDMEYQHLLKPGGERWFIPLLVLAGLCAAAALVMLVFLPQLPRPVGIFAGGLSFMLLSAGVMVRSRGRVRLAKAAALSKKLDADTMEELKALLAEYEGRWAAAEEGARRVQTVRAALTDRQARKENSRRDIFDFVHTFAPEVKELFGCSAALSRALNLEHERSAARERLEERKKRRDDLAAQGGQPCQTLELLHPPRRTPEETEKLLAEVSARLKGAEEELAHALGQLQVLGDPAALYARKEELEGELERRTNELEALNVALAALDAANEGLQRRFSPQLNKVSGEYFARLTGETYEKVSLNRELEGEISPRGEVLPRSALFLSRGTMDQLYLAVRLAVCRLCLPDRPPMLLDDAFTTFDDGRLKLALGLVKELAREQQIILFTCQKREGELLEELS